jgi:hypothetical protein
MLSLAEEQALLSPNQKNVTTLTNQLSDLIAQKQILQTELDSLS